MGMAAAQHQAGAAGQRKLTARHLHGGMRLATQLPHGLDDPQRSVTGWLVGLARIRGCRGVSWRQAPKKAPGNRATPPAPVQVNQEDRGQPRADSSTAPSHPTATHPKPGLVVSSSGK